MRLGAVELAYELKRIRERVPMRLSADPVDEIPIFERVAGVMLPKPPSRQTDLVKQTIEAILPHLDSDIERGAVRAQFGLIANGLILRSPQRRNLSAKCYGYSLSHFRQRGLEDQLFLSLAETMLNVAERGAAEAVDVKSAEKPHTRIGGTPGQDSRNTTNPHQIPSGSALLVGRSKDIDQLDKLASEIDATGSRTVVITAISGAGGIGKTALAVHWAQGASDSFPDGELFINLHGYDFAQPTKPENALEHFLRSLGVPPEQIPDDLEQRAALYRTALHGRRMLILLDNASDTEQVRHLLPGRSGCFVVVTSRSNLAGLAARNTAKRIILGRLTQQESIELISSMIGYERVANESGAVKELIAICDGLPLALTIVADQANSRPKASLRLLVKGLIADETRFERLRASDDPSANVRNVFEWSYQSLDETQARLFRLLAKHAGPTFSIEAAAALLGTDRVDADRLIRDLSDYHLVEEHRDEQFEFHDLLRDYATIVCARDEPPESVNKAIEREVAWYLTFALHGSQQIMPQRKELQLPRACETVEPPNWSTYQDALDWCEMNVSTCFTLQSKPIMRGSMSLRGGYP